jgi:hypothetical protein
VAPTVNSRRLRHERDMDQRLAREHRALAVVIGRIVMRSATSRSASGEMVIPNTRTARAAVKASTWNEALKPYYIGSGADPFVGPAPQSAFSRLLYEGIEGAIRIQAERQIAMLRSAVKDPMVFNWLTGPRSIRLQEFGSYDPFHLWVDPSGYRLSDRIWRDSIQIRSRIDALLDYHINRGTSAVQIARLLEEFLTPAGARRRTRTPYGTEGSYAARRLARTEITAAAGRATMNASIANPFVDAMRWALSAANRCCDRCRDYAAGGANGDGVYPLDQVPEYPAHPHEMCNLQPQTVSNAAELTEHLRNEIRARSRYAMRLQGAFNLEWLIAALLGGWFEESVIGEVA